MSSAELTVEATGETVGEAKWTALRELEQRYPALDKGAVRFEVVTEGERGLLGVGYSPARVVAYLPAEAADAVDFDESDLATEVRLLVSTHRRCARCRRPYRRARGRRGDHGNMLRRGCCTV